MSIGVVVAIIYGVLTIVGGMIGYLKSRSKASIISGSIAGLLLILSGLIQLQGQSWGLLLGLAITLGLIIIFGIRFNKTRQYMPAGLMTFLGAVVFAVMLSQLSK